MKINLLRNSNDIINGYLNIDPFAQPGENKVAGDITNLDSWCEDAEATEIIARDVIDFLDPPTVNNALSNWLKKLRHGGRLVIGGVDLYEVGKAITEFEINGDQAMKLLHGEQVKPGDVRKSNTTMKDMIQTLQNFGLRIISKRSDSFMFSITAERP